MGRRWVAAGFAAALWLASGAINGALSWNGILAGSIGGVLPATVPPFIWARPAFWALAMALVGAIGVALLHRAVGRATAASGTRTAAFVITWFAAVAAGAIVGLAFDVATIVGSLPSPRLQMLLNGLGVQAAVGGYWGLVQGWLPALLVVFPASRQTADWTTADVSELSRARRIVLAGAVAVALLTVVSVGVVGQRTALTATVQEEAIAGGFDEGDGALPDPYATGTPPATTAPGAPERDPAWCTAEQSNLLLGAEDAATGHRTLAIELQNFSDMPCVAEGYLDIAFADQNGNLLAVEVVPGGSFMTTDAGSQPVEVPAGGSAIARLGWNANATAGALIATTLFAAPFPGDTRGSWPTQTDIVEGSTVNVTAWELSSPQDTTAP